MYPMSGPSIQSQQSPSGNTRSLRARLALVFGGASGVLFLVVAWLISALMTADAPTSARQAVFLVAGGCWLLVVVGLIVLDRLIERRVTRPAAHLAELAEAVAAGDLTAGVLPSGSGDEVDRLARAVGAMVDNLASIASTLRQVASETASMAIEITSSSQQMSTSAGEIATTASNLSSQSGIMAAGIQSLASTSSDLLAHAVSLDEGAREGVERNARLRELAAESRARLDESSLALQELTKDVELNAAAAEGLASASEEVRSFVSLVHRLSRQSKLLSLNAAMEAARAGEHGEGFAVVANEVSRLAATSTEAAEKTATVVAEILSAVEQSRASSARTVETVRDVRSATRQGSDSFGHIERAVHDMEGWIAAVERTAATANKLVGDMTARLDELAHGTESFAAAMEQVAASSEQQSSSAEETATAAARLTSSAERLAKLVANIRTGGTLGRTRTPLGMNRIPSDQSARRTRSSTSSIASRPAKV